MVYFVWLFYALMLLSSVSVGDVNLMGGMGLGMEVSARSMYCPGAG